MHLLRTEISTQKGARLEKLVQVFLQANSKIKCRSLGYRPVFLTKYLASVNSRPDKTRRKQAFFAGIELVRRANFEFAAVATQFELKGLTPRGQIVGVHIREEYDAERHDRKLFLISTFFKDLT